MTIDHLWGRGVRDRRVLEAMLRVPREAFISPEAAPDAYEDGPIGIGQGQTISQPYMVAKMTELAEVGPGSRVLEIGGGSGYQTAVLLELGARVWSIEIIEELARAADARLRRLGTTRFEVLNRDGYGGLPEHAPYDAIIMAAAPHEIPPALFDQLAQTGRLVAPLGYPDSQRLHLYQRTPNGIADEPLFSVRFVPMTGRSLEEG